MKRYIKALFLCFAGSAGIFQCSQYPMIAGNSSSETTNGYVMGSLVKTDGSPAGETRVTLIPLTYNPVKDGPIPDSMTYMTNGAAGTFSLHVSGGGIFNIEAAQESSGEMVLITGIAVTKNDTTLLPAVTIKKPGGIKVIQPQAVDTVHGYVYLAGTTRFARISDGYALIDSVPAGLVPFVDYGNTADSAAGHVVRVNMTVISGDTATIADVQAWHYSRQLRLNTTASGADVRGAVHNFPVLIRLTDSNFVFNQANADGGDLRFTKSDGTPLSYEIEGFDPVTRSADVWVKVDTVYGNDSSQYITMYWGNPAASDNSKSAAVFDSASGFEGVWHMSETSGTRAADASHNGFSGIYRGGLPKNESGPMGICQRIMRPDTDYIDMGNVLNLGVKNISVGVWVKRAAFGTQQAVIAKTNGDGPSAAYGYLLSIDLFDFPHFYMASGGVNFGDDGVFDVTSNLTLTDSTTWHYVFISVDRSDNSRCKMYVDGIDRTGTIRGNVSSVANVANTLRLCVGTENDNNYSYKGAIDEATIAFAARSADWVKLSYMNQKDPDRLVVFGKEQ